MAGKYLAGRFADLIQSGTFQLHLDSKTFSADTSIRFLQGDRFGTSPRTQFGCLEGFGRVVTTSNASQDALGCGRCLLSRWTAVTGPCHWGDGHRALREVMLTCRVGNPSFIYSVEAFQMSSCMHGHIAIAHRIVAKTGGSMEKEAVPCLGLSILSALAEHKPAAWVALCLWRRPTSTLCVLCDLSQSGCSSTFQITTIPRWPAISPGHGSLGVVSPGGGHGAVLGLTHEQPRKHPH